MGVDERNAGVQQNNKQGRNSLYTSSESRYLRIKCGAQNGNLILAEETPTVDHNATV